MCTSYFVIADMLHHLFNIENIQTFMYVHIAQFIYYNKSRNVNGIFQTVSGIGAQSSTLILKFSLSSDISTIPWYFFATFLIFVIPIPSITD